MTKLLEIKKCKLKSTKYKVHFTNVAANMIDNWSLRGDPKGHRVLNVNGSLNNSRIFISENVLNQVEVERGMGEGNQERETRGACPFHPWVVNNLDLLWETNILG